MFLKKRRVSFKFFIKLCTELANSGKTIIISANDGDYKQVPFQNVAELFPKCEQVTKLNAVCMACFEYNAVFSRMILNDMDLKPEFYACCRKCLFIPGPNFRNLFKKSENYLTSNLDPTTKSLVPDYEIKISIQRGYSQVA